MGQENENKNAIDSTSVEKVVADFDILLKEAKEIASTNLANSHPDEISKLIKEELLKNNTIIDASKEPEKVNEGEEKPSEESQEVIKESENPSKDSTKEPEKVNEAEDVKNTEESAPINEKKTDESSKEQINENVNECDLEMKDEVEEAFDASINEENINLDDIESELDNINNTNENNEVSMNEKYDQIREAAAQLNSLVEEVIGTETPVAADDADKIEHFGLDESFDQSMTQMYGEGYQGRMQEMFGEGYDSQMQQMYEMHKGNLGSSVIDKLHKGETSSGTIAEEEEIDESHGTPLASNKVTGAEKQPRLDYGKGYAKNKVRVALQQRNESEEKKEKPQLNEAVVDKKYSIVLDDNKSLNKKLNTLKEGFKKLESKNGDLLQLNEQIVDALSKYKDQFKKITVWNANLAHVNSLFVNENVALSMDEKKSIIGRFKNVTDINESEKLHKEILNEYTGEKTVISEEKKSVEDVIVESTQNIIGDSSSSNLVTENNNKSALNAHIAKFDKLVGYEHKK